MYLPKESSSIFECDAPLQDTRYASLVELAFHVCICLGTTHDASCLVLIFGEFLPQQVGEEGSGPQCFDKEYLRRWTLNDGRVGCFSLVERDVRVRCSA